MDMQQVCAATLDEVDGALGCIVMDMSTGLTVAAQYRPGSPVNDGTINLVSVVSANMFAGKLMRQFEGALAAAPAPGFVREVQMTTANSNQFMAAIPGWNDGVFVLVTEKRVSLGLGWMAVHRVMERIQEGGQQGAVNAGQTVSPSQHTGVAAAHQPLPQSAPHVPALQHAPPAQPLGPQPSAAFVGAPQAPANDVPQLEAQPAQPAAPQAMPPSEAAAPARAARPSARAAPGFGRAKAEKEPEERPIAMGARANFMSRKKAKKR